MVLTMALVTSPSRRASSLESDIGAHSPSLDLL